MGRAEEKGAETKSFPSKTLQEANGGKAGMTGKILLGIQRKEKRFKKGSYRVKKGLNKGNSSLNRGTRAVE